MSIFKLINTVRAKGVTLWQEEGQLKIKAPKGAISKEIRDQLVENKKDIVDFLRQQSVKVKTPPLTSYDRKNYDYLPLSYAQERLWFIDQMEPMSAGYNSPIAATLNGKLDVAQIQQAFELIIDRHENLRTIFPNIDGRPHQKVLDSIDFKVEHTDLSSFDVQERTDTAQELCAKEAGTPFDIAVGPLIRVKTFSLDNDEHIIMLNMHHIISDGWSLGVLLKELGLAIDALKRQEEVALEPLPIQYADYSIWQRNWLEQDGVLEQQLQYWQEKLGGVSETSELSLDFARPTALSFVGDIFTFSLDAELTQQLKALSVEHDATLYMTLLALFNVLFYRYTGQEDICIGTPIANRKYAETQGLVGMFANTLALRNTLDSNESFAQFLAKVRTTCLDAYQYQDVPFEKIVDQVQPQRDLSISPLFQIMFALQDTPASDLGQSMGVYPLDVSISKFDFTVEFTDSADGLNGIIQYNTDLYRPQTINRLAKHYERVCRAVLATPDSSIGQLGYLDKEEITQLVSTFNQTQYEYPRDKCIHDLINEQVARTPNDIAVVYEQEQLTYQELSDLSLKLARLLQERNVAPENFVGLCVDRSLEMIVGSLGVLQAGAAYLPVDPGFPEARLAYMIKDCNARIVLTQEKYKDKVSAALLEGGELICLDSIQWDDYEPLTLPQRESDGAASQVKPHNLAYVIYTSGSTGQPKGVMTEHSAVVNLLTTVAKWPGLYQEDRSLAVSTNCFDMSITDLFLPLAQGAQLHICTDEEKRDVLKLAEKIRKIRATVIQATPATWQMLFQSGWKNEEGLRIWCGGEAMTESLIQSFEETGSKAWNAYGPTEATVYTSFWRVTDFRPINIGTAIGNKTIFILDQNRQLLPIGVQGELYVGGEGLARGYLNQSELTSEKFVDNPYVPGTKMYKSGDLARWLDDGKFEHLGRIDTQVKVRGFRIETSEIENQLNLHADIHSSAVLVQEHNAANRLVVFYQKSTINTEVEGDISSQSLKAHLSGALPEYMVPEIYVRVEELPLTANGKIDRNSLEKIEVTVQSSQAYVAPDSETEKRLSDLWAQLLDIDQAIVGVNDSFFELGGNSLLAARLSGEVRTAWGVTVPIKEVFTAPYVKNIARFIDDMLELKSAQADYLDADAETVDEGMI